MSDSLTLLLARHAKSSWRFANLDDFHRPLNKRGLRDAVRVPKLIAERLPVPDRVLASDAVRTVQTAQALADAFRLPEDAVELSRDLYLADHEQLLDALARRAGAARCLLLVGHNPGLNDLFNYLVGNPLDNLPTLAVAHLGLDAPRWDALRAGCATNHGVLLPRELS